MSLGSILLWPFTAIGRALSALVSAVVSLLLLPVRLAQFVVRSLWNRFDKTYHWAEPKINYLRSKKPLVYIFPPPSKAGASRNIDLSSIPSTPPVLGVTHGRDKRDLASRSALRRRPPSSASSCAKSKCDEDVSSMNVLIQDLLEFSKHHSPAHGHSISRSVPLEPATSHVEPPKGAGSEEETEKIMKLIKDLQEIASSKSARGHSKPLVESEKQEDDTELTQLLADLNTLQTYVSHFLDEQGDAREGDEILSSGSLETITEEETSKECSPSYCTSPLPPRADEQKQDTALLNRVAESEELQRVLAQIQEVVRQTEGSSEQGVQSLEPGSPESINKQFVETEKEFQTVIDALEHQHKFIETQQELQDMMNSLDPSSITASPPPNTTPKNTSTAQRPTTLLPPSPAGHQQLVYDSLAPQGLPPVYSIPKKKDKNASSPQDQPLPQPQPEEQIYDSIANVTTETVEETPPPIPMKRTGSDGCMSTSSTDHSPRGERRRHSSSGDEHRSSRRQEGHHRSRRHRRHSSRRSECHCCCYDDHSPERCGHHHHHRPRSRERHRHHHNHHHHHRSRSGSDESIPRRRVPRESSGYESQELDSPCLERKVSRSNSVSTTPKETRKTFLGGLFSRKSTTSLNSLSSKTSDAGGDGASVSSYRL